MQVRVVLHPIDFDRMTVVVLDDAGQVGKELAADGLPQDRVAMLHAEDRVIKQVGEGMGHSALLCRPCRGLGKS